VSLHPARGPGARQLGLPLPPKRMPLWRDGRLLKRWHYIGVFSPELVLCVGDARVGPFARRWWAVAQPDGSLHERTRTRPDGVGLSTRRVSVDAPGLRAELALGDGAAVEVVSPSGDSYIWTRKRAGVGACGTVCLAGHWHPLEGEAIVDESAGYHERHTSWRWSAGVGRGAGGERLAWNLVTGIHDAREASERTVWVDGRPHEAEPVAFAEDLSSVGGLRFSEWCAREEHINRLVFRSDYRQPFGSFSGELPGGLRVARGYGVMEEHDVLW
jgi:Protein of unknown function (DUF2804)